MVLLLIILLPLLGALLPPLLARLGRDAAALGTGIVTLVSLGLLLSHTPETLAGFVTRGSWEWIPAIGWNASFMLDGLGFLFAFLILGIGALIVLYARFYLPSSDGLGRFYAYLLLFMGAMLGVVLSDSMLLLVVFWELTSISSFLLIGYSFHAREGREGARMALAVTGAGGLALLGGVLVLGHVVGSYDLSVALGARDVLLADPLANVALVLILLGAFTKSAQFPFHFWLPHAMAAPTPVSAYLHSATMVKAGVFLLARFFPLFAGTDMWFWLVGGAGLLTVTFAAYWAIFKHDLKGLLAYSTVSHLGLITLLLGFGTPFAAMAAVFHILNHCAFKAALFMSAGIVDHEAGTRDIRQLGGLRHLMPVTATLVMIATAAMAGVPPLNGFLSKEMLLEESLHAAIPGTPAWLLPAIVVAAMLFSVTYSIRLVAGTFFGPVRESYPHTPHEPPWGMRLPVELLALACIVVGLFPALVAEPLVKTAAAAVIGGDAPPEHLALWHGFNTPLMMSIAALIGGTLLYVARGPLFGFQESLPRVVAKSIYDRLLALTYATTALVTRTAQNGSLQRYLALLVGTGVVLGVSPFLQRGFSRGSVAGTPVDFVTVVAWIMLAATAIATAALHRRRLIALVLMGTVGLVVTLGFVHFSAPDLALTQISVEFVTIVLILMALDLLPQSSPREPSRARHLRDIVIAGAAGLGVTGLVWGVLTRRFSTIGDYYLAHSVPDAGGHNVVNVILVDFRGYDTYGEISVLAIAALGIFAMIEGMGLGWLWAEKSNQQDEELHPLILTVVARWMLPIALLVSTYIFLRGHNAPGGGFIAALVTSVALILQYVAFGVGWTHRRLPRDFHPLIATGLVIAGATGIGSWWFGAPFLTSAFGHFHLPLVGDLELATAALFDLGVYFTVVGTVMLILHNMSKLAKREELLERARAHAAAASAAEAAAEAEAEATTPSDPEY